MGVKLQSSSGGSVEIAAPVTASNYTLTAPAASGTILNDVSSLAAAMLTGNVDVARLVSAFSGSNVSLGTSGYQKLPSGLIIQWGEVVKPSSGITTFTFPLAFPNACRSVNVTDASEGGLLTLNNVLTTSSYTTTSFKVTSNAAPNTIHYIAIGY